MTTTEHPDSQNKAQKMLVDIVGPNSHEQPGRDRGVEGNARLTATNGLLLLVMLAAEGATLLSIRGYLSWHIAIGLALIPPVALKLASTMWRFAHYYLGYRSYTASGPPHPLLRVLGPLVVLSTVALLATGIGLWLDGPGSRFGFLHRASFVVWLVFMTIHVLAHAYRAVRLTRADLRTRQARREALGSPGVRQGAVLASMAAGVVLALALKGVGGGLGQWGHHHFPFH